MEGNQIAWRPPLYGVDADGLFCTPTTIYKYYLIALVNLLRIFYRSGFNLFHIPGILKEK